MSRIQTLLIISMLLFLIISSIMNVINNGVSFKQSVDNTEYVYMTGVIDGITCLEDNAIYSNPNTNEYETKILECVGDKRSTHNFISKVVNDG